MCLLFNVSKIVAQSANAKIFVVYQIAMLAMKEL